MLHPEAVDVMYSRPLHSHSLKISLFRQETEEILSSKCNKIKRKDLKNQRLSDSSINLHSYHITEKHLRNKPRLLNLSMRSKINHLHRLRFHFMFFTSYSSNETGYGISRNETTRIKDFLKTSDCWSLLFV